MFPRPPRGPTWVEVAAFAVLILVIIVMVISAAGLAG